jgi:hypothetical protein
VQTLDRVLSVASRPGRCPNETCAGSRLRLLSAEAQSIALPHSTYGYDVLMRIGWWRYQHHATYREIHAELASHVRISVAHVSYRPTASTLGTRGPESAAERVARRDGPRSR